MKTLHWLHENNFNCRLCGVKSENIAEHKNEAFVHTEQQFKAIISNVQQHNYVSCTPIIKKGVKN